MNTIVWTVELRFLIALALGFLVGLERESSKNNPKKIILGGIRTYPIISMFGFGSALLHQKGVDVILPIGLIGISVLCAISYYSKVQNERFGVTSEISALLTFIVGALALLVDIWASMALGIINTMLLSEKAKMEDYVEKLDRVEFLAVLKFLLVTVIILPVLPNKDYTQFNINPAEVWQVVIVVSTIGFVGYFLSKKLGDKVGFWISGLVGGIVSSTAVTIAYGRIAKKKPGVHFSALKGAIVACSVMYLRILVLLMIISPSFVYGIWWQLLLLSLLGIGISLIPSREHHSSGKKEKDVESEQLQNPFEVRPAVIFSLLFVALIIITSLVKTYFGHLGLIFLSVTVGVADITPFVLSMVTDIGSNANLIFTAILISMMSNTIMKGIYFTYLSPTHRKETIIKFGILVLVHIPVIIATLVL